MEKVVITFVHLSLLYNFGKVLFPGLGMDPWHLPI